MNKEITNLISKLKQDISLLDTKDFPLVLQIPKEENEALLKSIYEEILSGRFTFDSSLRNFLKNLSYEQFEIFVSVLNQVSNTNFFEEMSSIQKSLFLLGKKSISPAKENYELFIKIFELFDSLDEIFIEDIFEEQEDLIPFAEDSVLVRLISQIVENHFGNLQETNYFDCEKIYFYCFIQILIQSKSDLAKETIALIIKKIKANPKLKNPDDPDDVLYFLSLILSIGKGFLEFKELYKETIKILESRNSQLSSYKLLRQLMGEKVSFTKHYGYSILITNKRTSSSWEIIFSTTSYRLVSIKDDSQKWQYLTLDSKEADNYDEFQSYIYKTFESFLGNNDSILMEISGHTAKDFKNSFGEWFQNLFADKKITVKIK